MIWQGSWLYYVIICDASLHGIGAVFSHVIGNLEKHVIGRRNGHADVPVPSLSNKLNCGQIKILCWPELKNNVRNDGLVFNDEIEEELKP